MLCKWGKQNNNNFNFVAAAWKCKEGPRLARAWQIDASVGVVCATTRSFYAYTLNNGRWTRLSTVRVKHCSVGHSGIWAVGRNNFVYRYVCGKLRRARGNYCYYYSCYFHMNKCSLNGFSSLLLLGLLYNTIVLVQYSTPTR